MNLVKLLIPFLTLSIIAVVSGRVVLANGGDVRIAEGRYVVNISKTPLTPVAGKLQKMLISFGDLVEDALVDQDIRVWIEIRKSGVRDALFPKQEFIAAGGVLNFSFTYPTAGLHELFVTFEKPDEPGKIYEPEDFLIDVQEPRVERMPQPAVRTGSITALMISLSALFFVGGFILGRYTRR